MKKIVKWVGKILSVLSIVFIVRALYVLGFDFKGIKNWPVFIGTVLICSVVKCVSVYISGSAWCGWLSFFSGITDKYKEGICVYAKANIGKYLPGNVMHYVERNLFADKLGISQKKLAASSLFEIVSLVGVALLMAILVSFNQLTDALYNIFGDNYLQIVFGVILAGILAVSVVVFLFRKKIKLVLADYTLSGFFKALIKNMFLYAVVLIMLGSIMVALYCYMGGTFTWEKAALIVSGYIIAWVLGFIVPGAPGGIGVRELVITVLLSGVVGESLVVTLSVTHRLITIIGDFFAYFIVLVLGRKR